MSVRRAKVRRGDAPRRAVAPPPPAGAVGPARQDGVSAPITNNDAMSAFIERARQEGRLITSRPRVEGAEE